MNILKYELKKYFLMSLMLNFRTILCYVIIDIKNLPDYILKHFVSISFQLMTG